MTLGVVLYGGVAAVVVMLIVATFFRQRLVVAPLCGVAIVALLGLGALLLGVENVAAQLDWEGSAPGLHALLSLIFFAVLVWASLLLSRRDPDELGH